MKTKELLTAYAAEILNDNTTNLNTKIVKLMTAVARSYYDTIDYEDNDWDYRNREKWTKKKLAWSVLSDMRSDANGGKYDELDAFEDAFTSYPSFLDFWKDYIRTNLTDDEFEALEEEGYDVLSDFYDNPQNAWFEITPEKFLEKVEEAFDLEALDYEMKLEVQEERELEREEYLERIAAEETV